MGKTIPYIAKYQPASIKELYVLMRKGKNLYLFLGKNRYCDNLVILIPIIPVKEKVIIDDRNKTLEFKKYKIKQRFRSYLFSLLL